jgi:VTC domain
MSPMSKSIGPIPVCPTSADADALARRLATWRVATPQLLQQRELLRRIDTKYVVPVPRLLELVADLALHYAVIHVARGPLASYRSLYFDTADLHCFHDHRPDRRGRHKVRIRHYVDRALRYLEIKTKRDALVTDKHRIAIGRGQDTLGDAERAFARLRLGALADHLGPTLWVDYRRIGLIGLTTDERVTIDLGVETVDLDGRRLSLGDDAVVEVKRAPSGEPTPMMRALAGAGLRERSMSKYKAAIAALRPGVRSSSPAWAASAPSPASG